MKEIKPDRSWDSSLNCVWFNEQSLEVGYANTSAYPTVGLRFKKPMYQSPLDMVTDNKC